jgi:recombination protein U
MIYDQQKARQQYQNAVNNAQGHFFEGYIKAGCITYHERGRAEIDKTPEPFRVTKKHPDGTFTGRFTAHAQPDFQGTLAGGRSICFEAKYTTTEQMKRGVLTETQMKLLEEHERAGAVAGVCIGIKDQFYFIPWAVWQDMKAIFGRQYITATDVEEYRVKFNGAVLFLDYIHKERRDSDGQETQKKTDGQGYTANGV